MDKEQLFAAINGIDEELIERSEKDGKRKPVRKWIIMAACFCFVFSAAVLLLKNGGMPVKPEPTLPGEETTDWTVHYMQHSSNLSGQDIAVNPIAYQKDLSIAEMETVLPNNRPGWLQGTGYAGFDDDGTLRTVHMDLETPLDDEQVVVYISNLTGYGGIPRASVPSVCNGVEFAVYEYEVPRYIALEAEAWIHDFRYIFRLWVWPEDVEQGKAAFKQILETFAKSEAPAWSEITSDDLPETYDVSLTWEEAGKDESFGACAPLAPPEGADSGARRYIGFHSDYLELYWTKGESKVSWTISNFDIEKHSYRMTSVDDIYRNLELSGNIYNAEDLTERLVTRGALQAKIKNRFGIKCGAYLIEIDANRLDSVWLWEQLVAIGIVRDLEEKVFTDTELCTLNEVYADTRFGSYYPKNAESLPGSGFYYRYESDRRSYLEAQLSGDESFLCLHFTDFEDESKLVGIDETEKYDLSNHSIGPWDPDLPEQYRDIMLEPVFEGAALTLEAVRARVYYITVAHTEPRMEFGVRYGNVVVYVFASGFSPETVYDYLMHIQP